MDRQELERILLVKGEHPGYEYSETSTSGCHNFPSDHAPSAAEGWELDVDGVPATEDDEAGQRLDENLMLVTTFYWRRKIKEVSLEELENVAIGLGVNTDYDYDVIEGPIEVSTEHGNLAVRLAKKDHRLDEDWIPNVFCPHYLVMTRGTMIIRIFRKRR